MAVVTHERMRDSTGAVHLYREVADMPDQETGHREPPESPHPAAVLRVRFSGFAVVPTADRKIGDVIAYYAEHPDEGEPISGDETARFWHWRGSGRRWPCFCDIAHVLYPGGAVPVPVRDTPLGSAKDEGDPPAEPEQLDIYEVLAALP